MAPALASQCGLHLLQAGRRRSNRFFNFTVTFLWPSRTLSEALTCAGVELGGALKNVLAIACGISDGLGFGNNGRAALITRGLAEMTRLAVAAGAGLIV